MPCRVVNQADLPANNETRELEGYQFGNLNLSLILVEVDRGGGPKLHRHPYEEVFVIHEGQATYTFGSTRFEAHAGQILIVPPGIPHSFINSGCGKLRQTDIHLNARFDTEWLAD